MRSGCKSVSRKSVSRRRTTSPRAAFPFRGQKGRAVRNGQNREVISQEVGTAALRSGLLNLINTLHPKYRPVKLDLIDRIKSIRYALKYANDPITGMLENFEKYGETYSGYPTNDGH